MIIQMFLKTRLKNKKKPFLVPGRVFVFSNSRLQQRFNHLTLKIYELDATIIAHSKPYVPEAK